MGDGALNGHLGTVEHEKATISGQEEGIVMKVPF
jgi:hypothetical protein